MKEETSISGYRNNMNLALAEEPEFKEEIISDLRELKTAYPELYNQVKYESVPTVTDEIKKQFAAIANIRKKFEEIDLLSTNLPAFNAEGYQKNIEETMMERLQEKEKRDFFEFVKEQKIKEALKTVPLGILVEELFSRKHLVDTIQILPDEEITIMKRSKGARCWETILEQEGCLTVLYTED